MAHSIIGRERALIDGLTDALQKTIGGPPPSRRTLDQLRRHNSSHPRRTARGSQFEVQVVDPDGKTTGHIIRVTVEIDRFEEAPP